MNLATLFIRNIRRDYGTQLRVRTSAETVERYAELIRAWRKRRREDPSFRTWFPPVDVFRDEEDILAAGHHRIGAHEMAGEKIIEAVIHEGTLRDAILFAAGSNKGHGLQPTREDERNVVRTLLEDPEWSTWPNTRIADHCGISPSKVARIIAELSSSKTMIQSRTIVITRKGKTYAMRRRRRVTDLSREEQADKFNREEYEAELRLVRQHIADVLDREIERAEDFAELAPLARAMERARRVLA